MWNPDKDTHPAAEANYIQSVFQNCKSLLVQRALCCGHIFLHALVHIPVKINVALWLGVKHQWWKVASSTPDRCHNGNHLDLDIVSPGVYKATWEHMTFQGRQWFLSQNIITVLTQGHLIWTFLHEGRQSPAVNFIPEVVRCQSRHCSSHLHERCLMYTNVLSLLARSLSF